MLTTVHSIVGQLTRYDQTFFADNSWHLPRFMQ